MKLAQIKKRIWSTPTRKFFSILALLFISLIFIVIALILVISFWPDSVKKVNHGVTFSAKYARELELDPKETFSAIINDLGVRNVRLMAYWDEIEKNQDEYNFSDLDWQIEMASKRGVNIILSVGRRLPRWPECHIPNWAEQLEWQDQKKQIEEYITATVTRYKNVSNIKYWQVENEPFLTGYVPEYCGNNLDVNFLDKEIALVKSLDPNKPILLTDSGELSNWKEVYKRSDVFGSTMYLYLANKTFDDFRMPLNHGFYNLKKFVMEKLYGEKETFLIEISIEPWLRKPIIKVPIKDQLKKMNLWRAEDVHGVANRTGFSNQYFWGVEWWYYLKVHKHDELWNYFKDVFSGKI